MKRNAGKHWPLLAAIALLWLAIAAPALWSAKRNEGDFIYAIDDVYVHMAIAKNVAQHGVWGITKYEFSSTSSSLLWTLLLSGIYAIWGVNDISPFIMNIFFATLVVFVLYFIVNRHRPSFSRPYVFLILSVTVFVTPLPALVFTGLEQPLHVLIAIVVVYLAAKVLSGEEPRSPAGEETSSPSGNRTWLLVLAPLSVLIRYESLFLLLVVCILLMIRRRWLYSLLLGAAAIIPVAVYGMISLAHGWSWVPNTLLLKGHVPDLASMRGIIAFLGFTSYEQLFEAPHMLFLVIAALIIYASRLKQQGSTWDSRQVIIIIFVATTLLHLQFARIGWFYRYEAYLVAPGMLIIGTGVRANWLEGFQLRLEKGTLPRYVRAARYVPMALLILIVSGPFVIRASTSLVRIPQCTVNNRHQQHQMGLFLKEFYQGQAVAVNDIGAVNYLADIRCLDMVGLGSRQVAKAKRGGRFGKQEIDELTSSLDVKVAIVFDEWFEGRIPSRWSLVGRWRILNNAICASDTVSFYAVDPAETEQLTRNLQSFSSRLPEDVIETGPYTQ